MDGQDGVNITAHLLVRGGSAEEAAGAAVFLELNGAAHTCEVFLNGEKLCHHEGGYSAFRVELTGKLRESNTLEISVSNEDSDRVYPQKADFTFYGGLYREVKLIAVPKEHFVLGTHAGIR